MRARYWQAARNRTVSTGHSTGVCGGWPETQSEASHFSAVRCRAACRPAKPLPAQALVAAACAVRRAVRRPRADLLHFITLPGVRQPRHRGRGVLGGLHRVLHRIRRGGGGDPCCLDRVLHRFLELGIALFVASIRTFIASVVAVAAPLSHRSSRSAGFSRRPAGCWWPHLLAPPLSVLGGVFGCVLG